eukprot:CAMPEP_0175681058 /NCGR_PEP_ID=MMETSP0097-20121207/25107_1 /TAXON_ID=311494 /ORGANISM="Alexandrium monilatum, Strain CCMP3105" /LENGTH=187 /DNA_ID=CAMNT_0016987907 /DNA_START=10 /DNA_END=572 /DNA_ORIENTATION=-
MPSPPSNLYIMQVARTQSGKLNTSSETAALDVDARVSVVCARLQHTLAVNHELWPQVIHEAARGLSAVHHPREAVVVAGPRLMRAAEVCLVEVWEALRARALCGVVALRVIHALDLREVHELRRAAQRATSSSVGLYLQGPAGFPAPDKRTFLSHPCSQNLMRESPAAFMAPPSWGYSGSAAQASRL